ncbi:MAG: aminodeoxychorismate synthase component I [Alphaproteobacteria bacterium]|nr:aminodeoxychorismate synthase component I [Alphaproteobacteria bacterium]
MAVEPFILLDDARMQGSEQGPGSLLFTKPRSWITAYNAEDVEAAMAQLEKARMQGFHIAGCFSYELGYAFEPKLARLLPKSKAPLISCGMFQAPQKLTPAATADYLARMENGPCRVGTMKPQVSAAGYVKAMQRVLDYIRAGDAYQVNLTFPLHGEVEGDPVALYRRLRRRQHGGHQALVHAPDGGWVLSLSPELFMQVTGDRVVTRPMKGTAPRAPGYDEDRVQAESLVRDPKAQSENLMIVDLLRNDLARLALPGSVQAGPLYQTETYPTLHQLTSTVTARLPPGTRPLALLRTLFPCGSVTGAPKIRAMEIIRELEAQPRGAYCGAIGMIAPPQATGAGDMLFNVAIRTLTIRGGHAVMGVGSAVVADSSVDGEYEECVLKARFVTQDVPAFDLLETMRWREDEGFYLLDRHLARLRQSAFYFGYGFDETRVRTALARAVQNAGHKSLRVRLTLAEDGAPRVEAGPLTLMQNAILRYAIADRRADSRDPFLRHKTTNRGMYENELARLKDAAGCDEVIFLNERGEVTEAARANVFARFGATLFTPPLSCGVLDGCLRRSLFDDPEITLTEKVLTPADLEAADEVLLGNSVRGLMTAVRMERQADGTTERKQA